MPFMAYIEGSSGFDVTTCRSICFMGFITGTSETRNVQMDRVGYSATLANEGVCLSILGSILIYVLLVCSQVVTLRLCVWYS